MHWLAQILIGSEWLNHQRPGTPTVRTLALQVHGDALARLDLPPTQAERRMIGSALASLAVVVEREAPGSSAEKDAKHTNLESARTRARAATSELDWEAVIDDLDAAASLI